MHDPARNFFMKMAPLVEPNSSIVEFGSLDINGKIKDLFSFSEYIGIDIVSGPGVDVVADASEWEPSHEYDAVLCAEVFEHTDKWPDICANAFRILRHGGRFIGSCAGVGRTPHSAIDGGEVRPFEFYKNIEESEMIDVLTEQGWVDIDVSYFMHPAPYFGDLYFTAVKP